MISRFSRALIAPMLAIGLACTGAASAQTLVTAITGDQAAACDALAVMVADDSRVPAQVDGFMATFAASMKPGDGSLGDLDQEFPGLTKKVITAMRPVILKAASSYMPPYRAELSALYCSALTLPEAREAHAEMNTPAFRSFIDRASQAVSYEDVVKDAIADRDVSAASVRAEYSAAGRRIARQISPAESAALMKFLASPTGRKLAALNAKKAAIDAKWFNYSSPEADKEMQDVIINTMVGHIALTDKDLAEKMRAGMVAEMSKPAAKAAN